MILELLQRICKLLEDHNIPFMVSGSVALNIYSIPRMTRDIDIVIELDENRIDQFISLFPDSYFIVNTIKDEVKRQGIFNIIDNKTGFKIDFIIKKDTDYYNLAFKRRQWINELETGLWVISIEDLIIAKLIWIQQLQSDTRIKDIENLLFYPEKDMEYIRKWINELKLHTLNLPLE